MPKDMSGTLRKNREKTTEQQPNYKGLCNIRGTEYWMSLWRNMNEQGEVYLSVRFEEKDPAAPSPAPSGARGGDDGIPF